jgi:hypothetical protein
MPSHFWYLLAFRAYMLRVVLADSDLLSGILIFFFNHFFKSPNYFCSSNVLSQKDLPLLFNRQNVTDSTVKIRFLWFFSEFVLLSKTLLYKARKRRFSLIN